MVDVIIPAGGRIPAHFVRLVGTDCKPLIKFNDRTVLSTTIEALKASGIVNRIVVVGPQKVLHDESCREVFDRIPEGNTGPENIFRGLDALVRTSQPPVYVLIVTADLPFLTGDIVREFVTMCPSEKDFCVPLISLDEFQEVFPNATGTFVGLQDGKWTAGCMYLATATGLRKAIHHIEQVFQRRKSKLGMARLLGFKFVWDLVCKKLTVSDVETKVRELLACEGAAVPGSPPELAYDIDDKEDYYYALNYLKQQARKGEQQATTSP